MCKEQRPLSTVRFLADALSLSPTFIPSTPETNQPTNNDNENALTPEETLIFQQSYLQYLTLTDTSSPPAQDIEEMSFRGIPPPSDEDIASARETRRDRDFGHWRQTQRGPRLQWLLNSDRWFDEPEAFDEDEEYDSDDDYGDDDHHHHPNTNTNLLPSANDNDNGRGENASYGLQSLEAVFMPQAVSSAETVGDTYIANGEDMDRDLSSDITEGVSSPIIPAPMQEVGETVVQTSRVGDDDAVSFRDELLNTVPMVDSDDTAFAEPEYRTLRSDSVEGSELEEGEVRE